MSQSKTNNSKGPNAQTKAVALKYNSEQDLSPVVIASGYGHVAEKIIDIAETRGIPVYRDDSAASMLCMLDVGSGIPEELYKIVATIYCQILSTASKARFGIQPPPAKAATVKSEEEYIDEQAPTEDQRGGDAQQAHTTGAQ